MDGALLSVLERIAEALEDISLKLNANPGDDSKSIADCLVDIADK